MKLGGKIPHIILAPGNGLKCRCGSFASRFVLCRKCREIVATCMGHLKSITEEATEHCEGT